MAAISFQEGLRKLSFTIRRWLNDNAIINKGTLINNFDLNDFTNTGSSGYYFLSETNSYINAPNNFSKEGILINFVNSDNFYQLILDLDNCFYIRTKNNNIWFSWKNYNVSTFEEQILNINEFIGNVEEPKETSIIKKIEKIEENSKELEKKVEKLEYVSKGVLYKDVTNEGIAKGVTITDDVLPYGAISMIGGASYTRARNCIPFPYDIGTGSYFINGIRRTIYSHAMIEYHGTATKDVNDWLFIKANGWNPGKHKFLLSGCYPGGSDDTYYLQVALFETASSTVPLLLVRDYGDGAVVDASDLEYECMILSFVIKSGAYIDGNIYPQLDIDKRTPWEPYKLCNTPVKRIVRTSGVMPSELKTVSCSCCHLDIYNDKKHMRLITSREVTNASVQFTLTNLIRNKKYTLFIKVADESEIPLSGLLNDDSLVGLVHGNTIKNAIRFNKMDEDGILRYPFSASGVYDLYIGIDFKGRMPTGSQLTLCFDLREDDIPIPSNVFEESSKTVVYEIPDTVDFVINEEFDAYYGDGIINQDGYSSYNYIDFDEKKYHRNVLRMNHFDDWSSSPYITDYSTMVCDVANDSDYSKVADISRCINEDDPIIPITKGDIITFETKDGEVPVPVPYRIKYQVKI